MLLNCGLQLNWVRTALLAHHDLGLGSLAKFGAQVGRLYRLELSLNLRAVVGLPLAGYPIRIHAFADLRMKTVLRPRKLVHRWHVFIWLHLALQS